MRQWAWRIGSFAGIDVLVHATFLLIILWVGLSAWAQDGTFAGVASGIAFILALFGTVVVHEFGHALVARRYGIKTRDITLWPIGGVATLERMPDKPTQEFWVALAGPVVSGGIALVLFVWLQTTREIVPLERLTVAVGPFLQRLMIANVILAVFNILPAFPMDGGRVLRAFLAMRMDYARATRAAATVGQAMALLFGFVGLVANPFLLFVALFVWIAAAQESAAVQTRSALSGVPVSSAMTTRFRALGRHDTLRRAVELVLEGAQQDFPVVEDGSVVGVLTRDELLVALGQGGEGATVASAMQANFTSARPQEMLSEVAQRLQECQCHTLPVLDGERLVGLLTMDNIGEYMMIRAALEKSGNADSLGRLSPSSRTWTEGPV
ncbi:MAG: site-2 protease family protein [Chloroflexota bacterium]